MLNCSRESINKTLKRESDLSPSAHCGFEQKEVKMKFLIVLVFALAATASIDAGKIYICI